MTEPAVEQLVDADRTVITSAAIAIAARLANDIRPLRVSVGERQPSTCVN